MPGAAVESRRSAKTGRVPASDIGPDARKRSAPLRAIPQDWLVVCIEQVRDAGEQLVLLVDPVRAKQIDEREGGKPVLGRRVVETAADVLKTRAPAPVGC